MGYVYKILNTINGKFYIGSTCDLERRFRDHRTSLKGGYHQNRHLQHSFDLHGGSAFTFEEVLSCDDYQEQEQFWLDSVEWDKVYNINRNVSGGDIISYHPNKDAICKRISDTMKAKHALPEDINPWANISRNGVDNPNWKGAKHTTCSCGTTKSSTAVSCIGCRDKTGSNNPFYGKSHSEEAKRRMSVARKGSLPPNSKKVQVDGVIYESCARAGKALGIPTVTVHYRCCKSKNVKFKNWKVVGEEKVTESKVAHNAVNISCEGVTYIGYSSAAEALGLSVTAIFNRVSSDNYPEYYKL